MPAKTRSQIKVSPTYTAAQSVTFGVSANGTATVSWNMPSTATPVAPTKITDYKKIAAERKETRRKEMMAAAIPKLAYMKTLLDLIKAAPCSDATTCRNEILADFNTKIANLEVDAAGLPRYNYILSYKMDNGDDITHNQKEFNSSQMVYDFINDMVLTEDGKDDYDYSEKAYTVPSAAEIDSMMDAHRYNDSKQILFVGEEFINSVEFTLKRTQVNY